MSRNTGSKKKKAKKKRINKYHDRMISNYSSKTKGEKK